MKFDGRAQARVGPGSDTPLLISSHYTDISRKDAYANMMSFAQLARLHITKQLHRVTATRSAIRSRSNYRDIISLWVWLIDTLRVVVKTGMTETK